MRKCYSGNCYCLCQVDWIPWRANGIFRYSKCCIFIRLQLFSYHLITVHWKFWRKCISVNILTFATLYNSYFCDFVSLTVVFKAHHWNILYITSKSWKYKHDSRTIFNSMIYQILQIDKFLNICVWNINMFIVCMKHILHCLTARHY